MKITTAQLRHIIREEVEREVVRRRIDESAFADAFDHLGDAAASLGDALMHLPADMSARIKSALSSIEKVMADIEEDPSQGPTAYEMMKGPEF